MLNFSYKVGPEIKATVINGKSDGGYGADPSGWLKEN